MRVSCICPTYARPPAHQHLVEEAIGSFLRQDWQDKELIVLNDAAQQELVCDAPGVRIVNEPTRYESLGAKYNAAIAMATGDLICPWEDDDISLPWRLPQAVTMLGDGDYWKPYQVIYLPRGSGPIYKHNRGVRHHASVFRKTAWQQVDGYPEISGAQDSQMDQKLRRHCTYVPRGDTQDPLPEHEWAYIYRWGVHPHHLSGKRPHDQYYAKMGTRDMQPGRFILVPRWNRDYLAECRKALAAVDNSGGNGASILDASR